MSWWVVVFRVKESFELCVVVTLGELIGVSAVHQRVCWLWKGERVRRVEIGNGFETE